MEKDVDVLDKVCDRHFYISKEGQGRACSGCDMS